MGKRRNRPASPGALELPRQENRVCEDQPSVADDCATYPYVVIDPFGRRTIQIDHVEEYIRVHAKSETAEKAAARPPRFDAGSFTKMNPKVVRKCPHSALAFMSGMRASGVQTNQQHALLQRILHMNMKISFGLLAA
jgi:hypothetical protein